MSVIQSIKIKRLPDEDPDLSWLEQSDEQMGEGFETYAKERLAAYGETWDMLGIVAEAKVVVGGILICQTLTSGGLWGIESDSGDEYLQYVEDEQLAELRAVLLEFGFSTRQIDDAVAGEKVAA
jgi:hypothetical protein